MTAHAGQLICLELFKALGIRESLDRNVGVRPDQGFSDSQMGLALVLINLAGGKLPSGDFGENAAWWMFMILAFNINAAMKGLALGQGWARRRLKALRFHLIKLPGRVVSGSRLKVRLAEGHPSFQLLLAARRNISALAAAAPS